MASLNPGIIKTVQLLNNHGYRTTDSGDGETHDYVCDRDEGYVVVQLTTKQSMVEASTEIYEILKRHGVTEFGGESGTLIQAMYCPYEPDLVLVDIHNVTDRMLRF